MRVLMVLDNLSRDSGVSSIVMNLYKNINQDKIKIDFLIFKEGNNSYLDYVKKNGSNVYILSNPLSPKTFLKSINELKTFFKRHNKDFDIVHLHSPTMNEFTLKYAKKYNVPNRIIHSHSTMTSSNLLKKYINLYLQRNVTKYANYFFSCSSEAAEFLYGHNFCVSNKITLVKNAVDTEKFKYSHFIAEDLKNKYNLRNKKVAIHVSNFSAIKNVNFLVNVLRKLVVSNQDYVFLFVGDGPTKNDVEILVNKYGLDKYSIFTGRRNDVDDLLNCADVLLLPSIKEGLPVTVVEAQANGMKCIISDTITKEANAGYVSYLPLNEDLWVKEIEKIKKISAIDRLKICESFSNSEFNIVNEGRRIENIYLAMGDNL